MSVGADRIPPLIKTGERLAGLFVTLLLVVVHVVLWNSTGGLWRDEVTSANILSRPSYLAMWQDNHFDSFPVLFATVLRTWVQVGFGDSDYSLRAFGCVVSLLVLAALWLNARELQIETPLLSLLLFACLPVTVRFGSSVRGYGLGLFWLLMTLWAVQRLLRDPNRRHCVWYVLLSLAAVQTYYTNCLMILAISIGAGVICLVTRAWKTLAVLVGSGLISLASMLVYLPTIRFHKQWSDIQQISVTWGLLFRKFKDALAFGWPTTPWIWFAACGVTVIGTLRMLASRQSRPAEDRNLILFAAITTSSAAMGSFVYFKILSVETSEWYYLPMLALCGVLFDAVIYLLVRQVTWARSLRLVLFSLAAAGLLIADSKTAQQRMTSVDLLADLVQTKAQEKDLILVTHWQASITFGKYYRGKARWMTVPELKARNVQPYPEYREKMQDPEALHSVLLAIAKTLTSGGRVFLADGGDPPFKASPGMQWQRPPAIPPAPLGPLKWEHPPYDYFWRNETLFFLVERAGTIFTLNDWGSYQVFPAERLALHEFEKWRMLPQDAASPKKTHDPE